MKRIDKNRAKQQIALLKAKIDEAKANAPLLADLSLQDALQEEKFTLWISNAAPLPPLQQEQKNMILCRSLPDLVLLFRLLDISPNVITEIVRHETSHADEAHRYGLPTRYGVKFWRLADRRVGLTPFTQVLCSKNTLISSLKNILMAPRSDMSVRDAQFLAFIEKMNVPNSDSSTMI